MVTGGLVIMDEKELQDFSRSLTHLIFRNSSIVEDYHEKKAPLDNAVMKDLNKEIHSRIYTLLKWMSSDDEEKNIIADELIRLSAIYGKDWDDAIEMNVGDF